MRTSILRMSCVAVALAALVSYPGVSFGLDCGYQGAINPPLPDANPADGFCDAAGNLKANGGLSITLNNPMEVVGPGMTLRVRDQPAQGFFLPGTFRVAGSMLTTIVPLSGGVSIDAEGQILNDQGVLYIVDHFEQVRLAAKLNLSLKGNPALLNPSTFLIGEVIKLSSSIANVELDNAVLLAVGDNASIELAAPKADIVITNSVFFVFQNAGNTIGRCKFQPKVVNHKQVGQVIGLNDPNNAFICFPFTKL